MDTCDYFCQVARLILRQLYVLQFKSSGLNEVTNEVEANASASYVDGILGIGSFELLLYYCNRLPLGFLYFKKIQQLFYE